MGTTAPRLLLMTASPLSSFIWMYTSVTSRISFDLTQSSVSSATWIHFCLAQRTSRTISGTTMRASQAQGSWEDPRRQGGGIKSPPQFWAPKIPSSAILIVEGVLGLRARAQRWPSNVRGWDHQLPRFPIPTVLLCTFSSSMSTEPLPGESRGPPDLSSGPEGIRAQLRGPSWASGSRQQF